MPDKEKSASADRDGPALKVYQPIPYVEGRPLSEYDIAYYARSMSHEQFHSAAVHLKDRLADHYEHEGASRKKSVADAEKFVDDTLVRMGEQLTYAEEVAAERAALLSAPEHLLPDAPAVETLKSQATFVQSLQERAASQVPSGSAPVAPNAPDSPPQPVTEAVPAVIEAEAPAQGGKD